MVRAAARSLSFLFQYKLNTAVCQVPDAKNPDATERSTVKSGFFAAHQFSLSGYIISSSPSTLPQSRSGIVHFLDISVVAGYSALSSAVSLENTLLCLFRRRYPLLRLSMALVVYMTFLTCAENLNIGEITSLL